MKLKIGDFVIIGLVLIVASFFALSFTGNRANKYQAVILQDGRVVKRITLSQLNQPVEFNIAGKYNNLIRAEGGRIRFVEANCPDQTCVRTGWLTKPGQVGACLPNGVLIKIESSKPENEEIDIYLH